MWETQDIRRVLWEAGYRGYGAMELGGKVDYEVYDPKNRAGGRKGAGDAQKYGSGYLQTGYGGDEERQGELPEENVKEGGHRGHHRSGIYVCACAGGLFP